MRTVGLLVLAILASAYCPLASAQQIPAGTILPVMLNSNLDARSSKPGVKITGKIMQDVPLPDGSRIPKGSTVLGEIINADGPGDSLPSHLVISFTSLKIGQREIPMVTHLRALASANQVFEAKLPTNAIDDYGTSTSDWNTIQIGGAGVYRGNGEVVQGGSVVGRTTDYGAVTAKLMAAPQDGCKNDSEGEQALWLFSPWSCGVYGYSDLKIASWGDNSPIGEIALESIANVHIRGGSGWLLRTDDHHRE
jgi:hypothetical protein